MHRNGPWCQGMYSLVNELAKLSSNMWKIKASAGSSSSKAHSITRVTNIGDSKRGVSGAQEIGGGTDKDSKGDPSVPNWL